MYECMNIWTFGMYDCVLSNIYPVSKGLLRIRIESSNNFLNVQICEYLAIFAWNPIRPLIPRSTMWVWKGRAKGVGYRERWRESRWNIIQSATILGDMSFRFLLKCRFHYFIIIGLWSPSLLLATRRQLFNISQQFWSICFRIAAKSWSHLHTNSYFFI